MTHNQSQTFRQKWGDDFFASRGYIQFPSAILEYLGAILKPNELVLILTLLYWKFDDRRPFPSIHTLADCLAVTPRSLQRTLHTLQTNGWIKIYAAYDHSGRQLANEIDFRPLRAEINKKARLGLPGWALDKLTPQIRLPYTDDDTA